tara:strand:- start:17179 stop:18573 length:1395 start_codon:yes stop_codon:yes gene_type:complete
MEVSTEKTILANLVNNDPFMRKVLPFIKEEYFSDRVDRKVFKVINEFVSKYKNAPDKDALFICISESGDMSESEFNEAKELIRDITSYDNKDADDKWLIDNTEKFCKDRSIYNAILESISIIDGKSENSKNHLPKLLQDALSVSFDVSVGHDYVEDYENRYDFYHKRETRIPFDLEFFNKITNNGTPPKTLNICLAGTGVGKSLYMCHHASNCLTQGKNVLYITCEMAEERIAERIDANLMDITMDELRDLPKTMYEKKIDAVTKGMSGKLIIKEYPTATANVNHFRALLEELSMKKKFKPDIIFIDYLNICSAARFTNAANVNSYMYVKAIAEELRGLAVEHEVPIFSATQTNRTGFSSTDVGLEDTSESFGLPATADFMFALISTDELDSMNQIMVKQLKNRYNDLVSNRKFIIGVNRAKMKLYDVNSLEQEDLVCSGQSTYSRDDLDSKVKKGKVFSDWNI